MEKAIAIFKQTEEGTSAVFIDQENIECARLNLRTKKRTAEAQKAQDQTDRNRRKAEAARAKFQAYTIRTFSHVAAEAAVVVGVTAAGMADMIHPAICIPVGIVALCAACVRLGAWLGSVMNR